MVRDVVRRPSAVAVLAALVVLGAGTVQFVRYPQLAGARDDVTSVAVATDVVGPRVGADLDAYVAGRHQVLAALPDDVAVRAVVSFDRLVRADGIPGAGTITVEQVHVVLPARETEPQVLDASSGDLRAAVATLLDAGRDRLEEEIAELTTTLSEDLGDPAFEQDFRRRLDELEQARTRFEDRAAVFGTTVVADVAVLRRLVDASGVRAVDPAGPAPDTEDVTLHAILPSDTDRATVGRPS